MAKIYVNLEQLEKLFSEYNIPYTNIFDELENLSAKDIAADLPSSDLSELLRAKDEVFAVQVWKDSDIRAAMEAIGILPDDETVARIREKVAAPLNDHSDNWDKLKIAIEQVMED